MIRELESLTWHPAGSPVVSASGNQKNPKIVSDGSGGAIITWEDYRSGSNSDIYVRSVDASGTSSWTYGGVAISTASNYQTNPRIVSDGAGGAIITWWDYRSGLDYDIYSRRVNSSGSALWTSDGVAIFTETENQINPQIIFDGTGGAIITWQDYRSSLN